MGCKECGKPKCNGKCGCKSPKVLQINNPAEYITFHKVSIPAAMGDSTTNPPKIGAYRNALVYYEADHTSWMYSTDGIPTLVTGEQGETGPQGPAGTIAVGTTTTGEPGTDAEVENVGTPENAILNFTIPKGDKGDQGIQGETGPQGYMNEQDVRDVVDTIVPEGFFDDESTVSDCGINFELENLAGGTPVSLRLEGDTFQQSYTGKNLFDIDQYSNALLRGGGAGVSLGKIDSRTLRATNKVKQPNNFCGIPVPNYTELLGQTVTVSGNIASYGVPNTKIVFAWNTSGVSPFGQGLPLTQDGTFSLTQSIPSSAPSGATGLLVVVYANGEGTLGEVNSYVDWSDIQLETGSSATSYEPFVGGTASPNPEFPQPIQMVTGSQTITINGTDYPLDLGKNLFDRDSAGYGNISSDGTINDNANYVRSGYISISPSSAYTLSARFPSGFTTDPYIRMAFYDANKNFISRPSAQGTLTATSPSNAFYCMIAMRQEATDIQLEAGSQATAYAPYKTPIKLCGLGDDGNGNPLYKDRIYRDGEEWKIHKATNTKVYDGTNQGFDYRSSTGMSGKYRFQLAGSVEERSIAQSDSTANFDGFCNELPAGSRGMTFQTQYLDGSVIAPRATASYGNIGVVYAVAISGMTLEEANAWLATHNMVVTYALENPTDTTITDQTLIAQLEAIRLQSGTNTISVTSEGLAGSICLGGYISNWDGTIESIEQNLSERVYSVDTTVEMSLREFGIGEQVHTLGYWEKGDGGGGHYYIVDAAGETPDGGSVIALPNGLVAKLNVKNDIVNVKQFGAKGDGVADDSAAIQAALAYNGNNKSIIKFVKGETYIVDGNFYIYSNTTMDLNDCAIKAADGPLRSPSYNNVQFMNNIESMTLPGYGAIKNFVVKNGTLNGNAGGLAFPLFHAQDCLFENIKFLNCFASGHVFDLGGCKNIIVRNSEFIGNLMNVEANNYREVIQPDHSTYTALPYWGNDPSFAFDDIPTDGLLVENCMFKKNDGDAYYLNAVGTHATHSTPVNNIVVRGCTFYDCQYSVIRLPYANNVLIEDNTFYNIRNDRTTDNFAINITNERSGDTQALHDVVVRGNKFISTQTTTDQVFIRVIGRADYLTTGVVVEGNTYFGTSVSEADYLGNDCAHMYQLDGAIFRSNTVNKAKNIIYTGSSPMNNFKFVDNICNGCLRGCRSGATAADPTSNAFPVGFVWANNIWTTPVGAVDTSGARIVLGIDEDLVLTGTSDTITMLSTKVVEGLPIYTTNTYNDIVVPLYFKKFRVTAVLKVQTASGSTVNYTRIQKYDRVRTLAENTDLTYNLDTAGEARSIYAGEASVDYSNLAWSFFSTDAERLWVDGNIVMKVGLNTTGDVTVLAEGTKIILEAF